MIIGLILTLWLLWALLFVFGLCAAASRPIPRPEETEIAGDEETERFSVRFPAFT